MNLRLLLYNRTGHLRTRVQKHGKGPVKGPAKVLRID